MSIVVPTILTNLATSADAGAGAPQAGSAQQDTVGSMAGVWTKVPELCDSAAYARVLTLMGVGGIQRSAAMLIDGMEVRSNWLSSCFGIYRTTSTL